MWQLAISLFALLVLAPATRAFVVGTNQPPKSTVGVTNHWQPHCNNASPFYRLWASSVDPSKQEPNEDSSSSSTTPLSSSSSSPQQQAQEMFDKLRSRASAAADSFSSSSGGGENQAQQVLDKLRNTASNAVSSITSSSSGGIDWKAVQSNILEGEFGSRGEVYVAVQFTVLVCIAAGGVPVVGGAVNLALHWLLGPALVVAGAATSLLSLQELGPSLSPWPVVPSQQAKHELKTTNSPLYSQVRHPIYAGLLALCIGVSLVSNSLDRLLWTAVLYAVLEWKIAKEEEDLVQVHGATYEQYMQDVPHKLVPLKLLEQVLPKEESLRDDPPEKPPQQ